MLDAEWSVEEVAEVALVEVSVHNPTAVDRRVRVTNRLDGPTLPPRSAGVPDEGWDADGYAGVVPADGTVRLGYASPAPATEPPVAVEDEGRADGEGPAEEAGPEAAVRLLGDGSPPADALPTAEPDAGGAGVTSAGEADGGAAGTGPATAATDADVAASVGGGRTTATNGAVDDGSDLGTDAPGAARATDAGTAPAADATGGTDGAGDPSVGGDGAGDPLDGGSVSDCDEDVADTRGDDAGDDAPRGAWTGPAPAGAEGEVPPPVGAWLTDAERRVEQGERLTDASVVEAAEVLDARGGLGGIEALSDRLAADEAALRALAERATALAERAAATDVPLAALRRLS